MDISFILAILAMICFLIGAVNVWAAPGRPNWTAAGLALLTLAWLVMKGKS